MTNKKDCTSCNEYAKAKIADGCPKHFPTCFCPECSRVLKVVFVQDSPDDFVEAGYCSEHGIIEL